MLENMIQTVLSGVAAGAGPQSLIGGDSTAGFYGEVPVSDFITGSALAAMAGLSAGTAINNNEPWLKFSIDGTIVYYSKRVYRHAVSWSQLLGAGVVLDSKVLTINGNRYSIGLPKGLAPGLARWTGGPADTIGCEWNRLLYPIVNSSSEPQPQGPNWANYSDSDLFVSSGAGYYSWCRETPPTPASNTWRIVRGGQVATFSADTLTVNTSGSGWRPRLQFIPEV